MFFNVNGALHRVLLKVDENPTNTEDPLEQTRRLYADPRGRKRTPRDRDDLLNFFPTPYPEEWWSILLPYLAYQSSDTHTHCLKQACKLIEVPVGRFAKLNESFSFQVIVARRHRQIMTCVIISTHWHRRSMPTINCLLILAPRMGIATSLRLCTTGGM